MRLFYGIISALIFSYCTAQDYSDFGDLELLATAASCLLSNGEIGYCVKQTQCKTVSTPGGPAGPSTDAPTTVTMPPVQRFTPRSLSSGTAARVAQKENTCGWSTVCCQAEDVFDPKHESRIPTPLGCGYSNPGGADRVRFLNGKATFAKYADFPWMVALMQKKNAGGSSSADDYIGGGTLIHPTVVMTVAHKVHNLQADKLSCRAGEWRLIQENEKDRHQDRDVANIIVNENFNSVELYYDVALLVLSSAYDLSNAPHIGVACLEPNMPKPGTVCYSMGWGKDVTKKRNDAKTLKKLELPLVEANECQHLLRVAMNYNEYQLHKSLTCAGGEQGVDTCEGDGGSSLVCRIQDPDRFRYSVVGMVAYGVGCGEDKVPGVYTKVPEVYDWVVNNMVRLGKEISEFKY